MRYVAVPQQKIRLNWNHDAFTDAESAGPFCLPRVGSSFGGADLCQPHLWLDSRYGSFFNYKFVCKSYKKIGFRQIKKWKQKRRHS